MAKISAAIATTIVILVVQKMTKKEPMHVKKRVF